ncbi:hypothetical protein [Halorubrum gandharaense]
MNRRQYVSLVTTTPILAGCLSTFSSGEEIRGESAPPSRDDLEIAPRPTAEEPSSATNETVSPKQYPNKPTSYDPDSIEKFVETHERAYRRNDLLNRFGGDLVSHSSHWDWTVTLETTESAGVGRCQYKYSETQREHGEEIIGDSPNIVVTYYVDDSMVVRAEDTGEASNRDELQPNPWESGAVLTPQNDG